MPVRHLVLLATTALAFAAFIAWAVLDSSSSKADVAILVAFAFLFLGIVFVSLLRRGAEPVEGHRGLPRAFWVVFASFGSAFAILLLSATVAMPFFGFRGFDALLGAERWWVLVVVAVAVYPFVRKHLL
jgi:hypothetical protein